MIYRIKSYFLSTNFSAIKLCLSVSFLGTVAFHLIIGSEWDDYDGFASQLFSGYLTKEPYYDFYSFGQMFVGFVYAFLHSLIQPVPWLAIFFHFYFIVSVSILLFIFSFLVRQKFLQISVWSIALLGSILFILIFSNHIIHLSHTVVFLLSGSALLGIWWLMKQSFPRWKILASYFCFLVLYSIGFLTRTETGLGASLIIGVFLLLYEESFNKLLKILIPPAMIALLIMGYVYLRSNEVPFLKAVELNLFYVSDGYQNKPEYTKNSAKDSIKYEAITNFFVNDEAELTIDLIQKMADEKIKYEAKHSKPILHGLSVAWSIMKPRISQNITLCLLNLLLFCLAVVVLLHRRNTLRLQFSFFLFQFFFALTLFSLAYFIKMENRHFIPLLQLFTVCNLLFLIKMDLGEYFKRTSTALNLIALLLLLLCFNELIKDFHERREIKLRLQLYGEAIREVNQVGKGKILLLDVNSSRLIHGNTLSLVRLPAVSKIMLYDMGELALIPTYKKYLDEECNCNSSRMTEFFNYLFEHKEDVLFISTDNRISLIQSYLQIVHGVNYKFEKQPGIRNVNLIKTGGGPLFYYALSKVIAKD